MSGFSGTVGASLVSSDCIYLQIAFFREATARKRRMFREATARQASLGLFGPPHVRLRDPLLGASLVSPDCIL